MAKYLKLFETTSQYNTYINGTPDLPNVSLCEDNDTVHYTSLVPVTGITLNPTTATIQIGSQTQVTATVLPPNASNKDVTWSSSSTSVLTISGSGSTVTLNGISEGYATVTCTSSADPTKTQTCSVEVTKIPVSEVTVTPSTATVNVGSTTTLDADVRPIEATYRAVTWASDNTNIATVDYSYSRCVVTGVSAGTATITATSMDDSTKYDTATVTVQNVAPPSNPVNEGYYTDTLNPIDSDDWYPENFEEFPIAIDQENTKFIPYDGEAMIQIWVKKGTTLANGLMSIYNDNGTNPIGSSRDSWGNPLFANYGLKCEGDCYFYNFHEVYDGGNEISFDIEIGAFEAEEPAKIYYEDQSGNKWYLFEWDGNY